MATRSTRVQRSLESTGITELLKAWGTLEMLEGSANHWNHKGAEMAGETWVKRVQSDNRVTGGTGIIGDSGVTEGPTKGSLKLEEKQFKLHRGFFTGRAVRMWNSLSINSLTTCRLPRYSRYTSAE